VLRPRAMKIEWDGTTYRALYSFEERDALLIYYRCPKIVWFETGTDAYGGPLPASGFYVLAHCEREDCCRPDGPFKTEDEAREWAQNNFESVKRRIEQNTVQ
jgi:hypothetical protein